MEIDSTPYSCLTPGDAAAAVAIATAAAATTITKHRIDGAALTTAAIAAKAIKFPTIIGEDTDIDDDGTAVTEIIQDQANIIN